MTENTETRVMALDYGKKRIGIALSDPLKTFAYSFITLQNDIGLFTSLETIIRQKSVIKIILGIPNDSRHSPTSVTGEVLKFKDALSDKFKVEVLLWDETYTSSIAAKRILESVSSRKKRRDKSLIDMNAASVILQEYLDSEKKNN